MARDDEPKVDEEQFKQLLRRALATPPITNEEIERRSKANSKKGNADRSGRQ